MAKQAEVKELEVKTPEVAQPLWEKTNDKLGLREAQPIYCPICTARALVQLAKDASNNMSTMKTDPPTRMRLRRSRIHTVADVRIYNRETQKDPVRPYANDLAFKCPVCDLYIIFGVPMDIEYAQDCLEKRGGSVDFVLPNEEWEEDEMVNNRLKRWGYW